jgi:hypothetical protein
MSLTSRGLQQRLRRVHQGVVLVPPRILERVLHQVFELPAFVWRIPHRQSWVLRRQELFRWVDAEELDLDGGLSSASSSSAGSARNRPALQDVSAGGTAQDLLPDWVLLLVEPTPEELSWPDDLLLREYWRRLFHAALHQHLEQQWTEGRWPAAQAEQRLAALGESTCEEIRQVLVQDGWLPANLRIAAGEADRDGAFRPLAVTLYLEFAALFLELYYFARPLLPTYFPSIQDLEAVHHLLCQDVNAPEVLEAVRLPGAADPDRLSNNEQREIYEYYYRLARKADQLERRERWVRAAILRTRAARVAPASKAEEERRKARKDLDHLLQHLRELLRLQEEAAHTDFLNCLSLLLDKADQGRRPVEAVILYDLERLCRENARPVFTLDLGGWLRSGGVRPLRRPLERLKQVRLCRQLHRILQRLPLARLGEDERNCLQQLLKQALDHAETQLTEGLRRLLEMAFDDAGLHPTNEPEQVARDKAIEELVDRVKDYGFFTFSDLRDTLARNQLKLPDLHSPQEFIRGDALLLLDRRCRVFLEGIYRPSEAYVRFLERLTALSFGTASGRWLTLYILLPFGGALFLLEALRLVIHLFSGWELPTVALYLSLLLSGSSQSGPKVLAPAAARPGPPPGALVGVVKRLPAAEESADFAVRKEPGRQLPAVAGKTGPLSAPRRQPALAPARARGAPGTEYLAWWPLTAALSSYLLLGMFLLGLLHSPALRGRCQAVGRLIYRALYLALVEWPWQLLHHPWLRRLFTSPLIYWPLYLLYWYLLKPLLVTALLWLLVPATAAHFWTAALTFLSVLLVLNSRLGRGLLDLAFYTLGQLFQLLASGLLPGMVRWTLWLFQQLLSWGERLLFAVDDWLRFPRNPHWALLPVYAGLRLIWFPLAYIARLYVVVLIEPGFNPIKFPVSSVAAKFIYPAGFLYLAPAASNLLTPLVGEAVAWAVVATTIWLLPDAVSFLIWEMKNNWELYRANRPGTLRPAPVGPAGETIAQLLRPGFHYGTIPRLYARLRAAKSAATYSGDWRSVRTYSQRLEAITAALRRFAERELLALLRRALPAEQVPCLQKVQVATNRLFFEFHTVSSQPVFCLEVRLQAGWLVAQLHPTAWLEQTFAAQRALVEAALLYWYKRIGIDLVWEQLQYQVSQLSAHFGVPAGALSVELTPTALRLSSQAPRKQTWVYDLLCPDDWLVPQAPEEAAAPPDGRLPAGAVLLSRLPVSWETWVACWQKLRQHTSAERLPLPAGWRLLPLQALPGSTPALQPAEASHDALPPAVAGTSSRPAAAEADTPLATPGPRSQET